MPPEPRLLGTIELENRSRTLQQQNLSLGSALKLPVGEDVEVGLGHLVDLVQQPSPHPAAGAGTQMQGEPVFFVRFHQVDPLRHAQPGVEPLGLPECLPGAGDGHEVSRGGENQRGLRRSHQNVVRMVHAVGGLSEDVLLRIAPVRGCRSCGEWW